MGNIYKPQGALRCFLALCVLWSHSVAYFFPEAGQWFRLLQLGNVAVACFFVLSGYLMFEAGHNWYAGRPGAFLLNRYLRITPPFLVAALASVALHFILLRVFGAVSGIEQIPAEIVTSNNALHAVTYPLFPYNYILVNSLLHLSAPTYDFVRYSWAIATELLFYISLYAYLYLRDFLPRRPVDVLALLILALSAGAGFMAYNATVLGLSPDISVTLSRLQFEFHAQWAPHFLLGVMLSVLSRRRSTWALLIFWMAAAASLLQFSFYVGRDELTRTVPALLLYSALIAVIFRITRLDATESFLGLGLSRQLDRRCGNLSYPIYINQYGLSVAFVTLATGLGVPEFATLNLFQRVAGFAVYHVFVVSGAAILIALTDTITTGLRENIRGAAV